MSSSIILSFIGASVALALMPGPDNIFVLTESLTKGYKRGVAISLGLSSGVLVHTVAAATGLSLVVQQSALAFSVIKYLGVAYLVFLAFKVAQEKAAPLSMDDKKDISTKAYLWPSIKKGFFMNVLNPKVALFFIAFLPQFVTPNSLNITVQMIILGLVFSVLGLLIFSAVALLSGQLSPYVRQARFWLITKWGKVGVLLSLALVLMVSKQ